MIVGPPESQVYFARDQYGIWISGPNHIRTSIRRGVIDDDHLMPGTELCVDRSEAILQQCHGVVADDNDA